MCKKGGMIYEFTGLLDVVGLLFEIMIRYETNTLRNGVSRANVNLQDTYTQT